VTKRITDDSSKYGMMIFASVGLVWRGVRKTYEFIGVLVSIGYK